jgi:hypothetical protein
MPKPENRIGRILPGVSNKNSRFSIHLIFICKGAHIVGDAVAGGGGAIGLGGLTSPVPANIANRGRANIAFSASFVDILHYSKCNSSNGRPEARPWEIIR